MTVDGTIYCREHNEEDARPALKVLKIKNDKKPTKEEMRQIFEDCPIKSLVMTIAFSPDGLHECHGVAWSDKEPAELIKESVAPLLVDVLYGFKDHDTCDKVVTEMTNDMLVKMLTHKPCRQETLKFYGKNRSEDK
jgi:hypothetical protein